MEMRETPDTTDLANTAKILEQFSTEQLLNAMRDPNMAGMQYLIVSELNKKLRSPNAVNPQKQRTVAEEKIAMASNGGMPSGERQAMFSQGGIAQFVTPDKTVGALDESGRSVAGNEVAAAVNAAGLPQNAIKNHLYAFSPKATVSSISGDNRMTPEIQRMSKGGIASFAKGGIGKTVLGTLDERELLARTIQAEAGGEGHEGMLGVGAVIRNRANQSGGIRNVIATPGQFSAWNAITDYARGKGALDMENMTPSEEAYRVADLILANEYEDPTDGATHYYNPGAADPDWGERAGGEWRRIGNHLFGSAGKYPSGPFGSEYASLKSPVPAGRPEDDGLTRVASIVPDSIAGPVDAIGDAIKSGLHAINPVGAASAEGADSDVSEADFTAGFTPPSPMSRQNVGLTEHQTEPPNSTFRNSYTQRLVDAAKAGGAETEFGWGPFVPLEPVQTTPSPSPLPAAPAPDPAVKRGETTPRDEVGEKLPAPVSPVVGGSPSDYVGRYEQLMMDRIANLRDNETKNKWLAVAEFGAKILTRDRRKPDMAGVGEALGAGISSLREMDPAESIYGMETDFLKTMISADARARGSRQGRQTTVKDVHSALLSRLTYVSGQVDKLRERDKVTGLSVPEQEQLKQLEAAQLDLEKRLEAMGATMEGEAGYPNVNILNIAQPAT
jgi:N-acetylmuramoyl-L-alanine amidase